MNWASYLMCDDITLQELLELFGIIAWTIVTPDYMR